MKIKELIAEGPFDTIKSVAGNVATAAAQTKADFNRGYKKMDKILSPSKWGKDDTDDTTTAAELVPHVAKQMLTRASTGQKLYNDDLKTIASLKGALAAGTLKTKQDPTALSQALKSLAQTRVADKNQAAMFAALANEV
jgi:hypothetical protein